MLSFLKEQVGPGGKGPDGGQDKAAGGGDEFLSVRTNSDAKKSSILFAVLFAAGLICLWFMIQKAKPVTVEGGEIDIEQAKMEAAITRLTGIRSEMFERMDEILTKFYDFSEVRQVEAEQLTKNPFMMDTAWGVGDGGNDSDGDGTEPEILRLQRLREQAKELQLLSIMNSEKGNCCMIEDRLIYEGDRIGGFTVTKIEQSKVELRADDFIYELELAK